jgi:hypothetical protein
MSSFENWMKKLTKKMNRFNDVNIKDIPVDYKDFWESGMTVEQAKDIIVEIVHPELVQEIR